MVLWIVVIVAVLAGGVGFFRYCQSQIVQRHEVSPHPLFLAGVSLILLILVGCGGQSQQGGLPSHPRTPAVVPFPSVTAQASAPVREEDWPTYHRDNTRSGYVANMPDPHRLTRAWTSTLDGAVYAEPLLAAGHVIVATEHDTLYALDPASGHIQWHTTVGRPVAQSTLPCGDIDPLGITGTPVYDSATGLVFAVAEVEGLQHLLVGVDVNTGAVRIKRVVDLPGMEPRVHQQRAALLLANKMVYIAYGGLAGDCGNYRGTIVASRTDGQGALLSYQVPVTRAGGIWTPPGPVADAAGHIFVAVGNGEETGTHWDHSDSVLRLSPTLQLEDGFAPTEWAAENSRDADLGSLGPTLLPNGLLFIAGKGGHAYLLRQNALGGVGGQVTQATVCGGAAMGGTAVLGMQIFVPCNDGLRSVTVDQRAHMTINWHAAPTFSPIIGGHTVYSLDASGTLSALASDTGAVRAKISLGSSALPSQFQTPTLANGRILVPTGSGVTAISLS